MLPQLLFYMYERRRVCVFCILAKQRVCLFHQKRRPTEKNTRLHCGPAHTSVVCFPVDVQFAAALLKDLEVLRQM